MNRPNFTRREASILQVLHLADGRWVSHEALIRAVWGDAEAQDSDLLPDADHTLRVNVSRIRRKLADLGWRIEARPHWYCVVPVTAEAERFA